MPHSTLHPAIWEKVIRWLSDGQEATKKRRARVAPLARQVDQSAALERNERHDLEQA